MQAKIVKLIEVISPIGKGTSEDPSRYRRQYYALNGALLFSLDTARAMDIAGTLTDEGVWEGGEGTPMPFAHGAP